VSQVLVIVLASLVLVLVLVLVGLVLVLVLVCPVLVNITEIWLSYHTVCVFGATKKLRARAAWLVTNAPLFHVG